MDGNLKLLAVFPHPDDETLGLGSTLARYSAEGVETYLVCATRGERGWYESEGPDPGFEGVARIREAELRCAAENLGLHEVCFLDYIDGDVDQDDVTIFESCALAGHTSNPYGIANEETQDHPDIFVCRNLRQSWPQFWQSFQSFG